MLIIGHRGACGHAPENSLMSLEKAIEFKVDIIEIDVHLCKTGEVVVIHDDRVNRTTNHKGKVGEVNLTDLQKMDIGQGETIPTLEQALNFINRRAKILIEVKLPDAIWPVYNIVKKYIDEFGWRYDELIIASFLDQQLEVMRSYDKKLHLAYLVVNPPQVIEKVIDRFNPDSINPYFTKITTEFIELTRSFNIHTYCWTVNSMRSIKNMITLGVDGIITDYPDRLQQQLIANNIID